MLRLEGKSEPNSPRLWPKEWFMGTNQGNLLPRKGYLRDNGSTPNYVIASEGHWLTCFITLSPNWHKGFVYDSTHSRFKRYLYLTSKNLRMDITQYIIIIWLTWINSTLIWTQNYLFTRLKYKIALSNSKCATYRWTHIYCQFDILESEPVHMQISKLHSWRWENSAVNNLFLWLSLRTMPFHLITYVTFESCKSESGSENSGGHIKNVKVDENM